MHFATVDAWSFILTLLLYLASYFFTFSLYLSEFSIIPFTSGNIEAANSSLLDFGLSVPTTSNLSFILFFKSTFKAFNFSESSSLREKSNGINFSLLAGYIAWADPLGFSFSKKSASSKFARLIILAFIDSKLYVWPVVFSSISIPVEGFALLSGSTPSPNFHAYLAIASNASIFAPSFI